MATPRADCVGKLKLCKELLTNQCSYQVFLPTLPSVLTNTSLFVAYCIVRKEKKSQLSLIEKCFRLISDDVLRNIFAQMVPGVTRCILSLIGFPCNRVRIRVFITSVITDLITYGAKLLNADWLRQRAFFLNHEGTFGNQEGMIT